MNICIIKEINKRIKQLEEDVEKHPKLLETIEAMKHWKEESIRKGFNTEKESEQ